MWTKTQSKKFQTPNYSKEFIRKPIILKELGNLKNKKILEFGCGSGYWTRIFAKKGAKCVGIDSSKEQIEIARMAETKKPLRIKYVNGDITNLNRMKSSQFDIVFIEYVLLEIPKKRLLLKLFKEANRVLKKDGLLFISDMHPFDPIMHKNFKLPKDFNYFKSGAMMTAFAKQLDGTMISFTDNHWTFEDYFSSINGAGFSVIRLLEPKPSPYLMKKVPYFRYRKGIPKDLIIIAKKQFFSR